jgi:hypothetical protein
MKVTDAGSSYALSRRVTRNEPENWGKSDLTKFLGQLESQGIATFAGMPKWVEALERIDKTLNGNAANLFHEIDTARVTTARLYMRAFATFRTTCRLAMSGQLYESTVLNRSIIESAVYAWACGHSQAHCDAWKARAKGETEKKAARKAFSWSDLIKLLGTVDEKLAKEIDKLYSDSIDFGAHPNIEGIDLSSTVTKSAEEGTALNTIHAHGPEAILLGITDLINTMQIVYRLMLLSVGDRLRLLNIDALFTADVRFIYGLIEEYQREKPRT